MKFNFFERINSKEMLRGLMGLILYVVLVTIDGCSGSDRMQIADQAYFPLRVGNYSIYQVTETDIQNVNCTDPVPSPNTYELKVFIYDSVKNSTGGYTYNIHRYTRPDDTQAWADLDTWSARVTNNQVIVNEGNTAFVKFSFPLNATGKWNGNQYNSLTEEDYAIQNLRKTYQLENGNKYSPTFTVVQSDNQDFFVYQDKRIEVYAATVGLIYKETTQLTYIQDVCYGQQKVKTGLIYKQELKSYGRE
jgi:hypothetical protein